MSAFTTFLFLSVLSLSWGQSLNLYSHQSHREFLRLLSRTADPCNKWTGDYVSTIGGTGQYQDCQSVPDAQVTVLLPSENSLVPGQHSSNVPKKQALLGSVFRLTVEGRGFASSDFADQSVLAQPIGTTTNSNFYINPYPAAVVNPAGQPPIQGVGSYFVLSQVGRGCNFPDFVLGATAAFYISDVRMSFAIPAAWLSVAVEIESAPRSLCYVRNLNLVAGAAPTPLVAGPGSTVPFYTGFKIGVVWNCLPQDATAQMQCPPPPIGAKTYPGYGALTFAEWMARVSRKFCCRGTLDGTGIQLVTAAGDENLLVGQCIMERTQSSAFPSPQACCGSASIETAVERCCNNALETVASHSGTCPCRANAQQCPTGESCCLPTKFPELINVPDRLGECYNQLTHKCCDTGARYDPGVDQCCTINGLQSANVPCPCGVDGDCRGGQAGGKLDTLRCCFQVTPALNELTQCNIYNNYPNGTGLYEYQRCPGTCIDPSYQICCNGVLCVRQFEKCCNTSCCNRFSQSCASISTHPGTPGNRYNYNDFRVMYEACTEIEEMQPIKAFWTVLMPLMCLLISLFATGLVLVFANKASSRSYAAIEKAMINIALITIIFNLVIFFSPSWKYGLVILFVQLFTIATAAARIQKLNAVCVALQVLLLLYLIDPFHGNQYLTLASSRNINGFADRDSAGLIHYIGKMFKSVAAANTFNGNTEEAFCPSFFLGFFRRDPALYDWDRFDNPQRTTFGYCDRSFILALLVFASLIYICAFIQLVLCIMALLLRFQKASVTLALREEVVLA